MEDYGTTGAKSDTELFRHAEDYLTKNPTKNLGNYRKEFGIKKLLKTRHKKGQPVYVNWKGKSSAAQDVRLDNLTYASRDSYDARQLQKAQHATDIGVAKKAGYDMFEEHLTAADQYFKFGHPSQGSDDVGNVRLRFTENKTSKDVMEDLSKRWHLPWATTLNDADETLVVNELEWIDHDYGHTLDLNAGVTMSDAEVKSYDNFLSTGDLGDLDEKKARYLMQEYGGKSGNLDEIRHKFIANVNTPALKKGAKISRKMLKLFGGTVALAGIGLSSADVLAREQEVKEKPNMVNKIQSGISKMVLATDVASVGAATSVVGLPAVPFIEAAGFSLDAINLIIDAAETKTRASSEMDMAARRASRTGRS